MKAWIIKWWVFLVIFISFWVSRLANLTILPVFADEAIYIRWAQMIGNEPDKHLFLPMYDGKPPLHMWLLTRFLPLSPLDPLWAGRFMSVLVGFMTLILLMVLVRELGGKRIAQIASGGLYVILPFTFFHDRMALIDPLFVLILTAVTTGLVIVKKTQSIAWTLVTGTLFGLALMTKTPALWYPLLLPFILVWLPPIIPKLKLVQTGMLYIAVILVGMGMFYLLKISPLFPFLFNRANDFSLSFSDIMDGEWRKSLSNMAKLLKYSWYYLTLPMILLPLLGTLVSKKRRYLPLVLVLLALVYVSPFILMGKVLYSRYYLPVSIFLIPAAAIGFERLWQSKLKLVSGLLAGVVVVQGIWFMWPFFGGRLENLRLPKEDVEQYLTSWSAGFGNKEVRDYLVTIASNRPVAVATEGYFGTLPDGLVMYFDKYPLPPHYLDIFGVGQPIAGVPQSVINKAETHEVYIVVNENRLSFDASNCCQEVGRYPRPLGGSPLLLLKYKL